MKSRKALFFVAMAAGVLPGLLQAAVELPFVFRDHMVLQREMKVPIWGTAAAGEVVTVTFNGQSKRATADQNGQWKVYLDSMAALATGQTLTVAASNAIALADVVVGEVWLCSGQSNMSVTGKMHPKAETFYADTFAAANYPLLRCTDIETGMAWTQSTPEVAWQKFSMTSFFFGRNVFRMLGERVPVGLVVCAKGSSSIEAWRRSWGGGVLFKKLIAPVAGYGISGAIWWQGEANVGSGFEYRKQYMDLITDWRDLWGQGDFPFYCVQLQDIGSPQTVPAETWGKDWQQLRECFRLSLAVPNTGMVVAADINNANVPDQLHPLHKWKIGYRLALWAGYQVYGFRQLEYSGPLYRSMRIEGNKAVIDFYFTYGGLATSDGGPVKGFAICGADGVYEWADATISNNRIELTSPKVSSPVAVRYGWAKNPMMNLQNSAGLPASPFQTAGDNQLPPDLFRLNGPSISAKSDLANKSLVVTIKNNVHGEGSAFYTLDNTPPTKASTSYRKPFSAPVGTVVRAVTFTSTEKSDETLIKLGGATSETPVNLNAASPL